MDPKLQEYLRRTADTLKSQGKSDDVIKAETKKVYDKYMEMNVGSANNSASPAEDHVGFFQSILQGVAKPFIKVGVSGSEILAGGVAAGAKALGFDDAANNISESALNAGKEGFDAGYFGNVRPFGSLFADNESQMGTGEKVARTAADVAGTGAEIASYAFAPLKVPTTGGFFKALLNPASLKAVAPFAAPFALGKAGQAYGEGKSGGEALAEGAGAYLGAAVGFNLLNSGGVLLGNFGARLMRSPIIKAQTEKLADLADVIVNAVPPEIRTKIGDTLGWNSRMYQKEFETAHKKIVDATIDQFTSEAPTGNEAFQGYRQSLNKYITSQYNKKATDFQDVFSSPYKVGEFGATKAAVDKAESEVETLVKSGLYESGQNLQNYIGRVKGILGSGFNKPQSLKIVDALYSAADGFVGKSNAEDALIRDISHAILDDATLSVSKGSPELLNRWNQARTFAQDISTNVNSDFAGKMKNAPKLNNFVDSLLTGSGPSREEVSSFNRAFTPQEKTDISQSIFNSVISKAKNANTLEEGAAVIDKVLKNLNQYGDDNIIEAGHAAQLENLSDLMKSNFKDFVFRAQGQSSEEVTKVSQQKTQQVLTEDMVKLADSGRYSELGDRLSKITGTEEVQAVLKLVGDDPELQKGVGQEVMRGILNKNKSVFVGEDGKYNFSGFFSDLNKIGGPNKDEVFNSIFTPEQKSYLDYLYKLREEVGSIENLKGESLLKFAHGVTGLLYSFSGKVVPATYHLSQIAKVSSRSKIPYAQLKNLAEGLSSEGRLGDSWFMKLGDAIKAGSGSGAVVGGQEGSQQGPTIEAFMQAAEHMFGRPLNSKDKKELETLYNQK